MGAALLFLTFLTGVGSFLILHQLERKVKRQIAMDQFTGSITIQLRASILTIEESEKRLKIAKAAMLAGCVYVPSCPAFTKAYELQKNVEETIQKIAEGNWSAQNLKWTLYHPFLSRKSIFPEILQTRRSRNAQLHLQLGSLTSETSLSTSSTLKKWTIAWTQ